jgi:glycosyltransferase involved in cell wall biosynthesis
MKIFVHDGLRHMRLSGYGMLSRNLIQGLRRRGHEIGVQKANGEWGDIEPEGRSAIEEIPSFPIGEADLILQIGTPAACREFKKPTLMYTQNALGDLRQEWVEALSRADGCIVPGEFDRAVFAKYFDRVHIARQSSDPGIFQSQPAYRDEGPEQFTFLFVGSYSFRKGVDLLLEAYLTEFERDEDALLILQCPGVGRGNEFNHLLDTIQRFNPNGRVRLFGAEKSPHWMSRMYNRSDCVVTMSRGEGWCMPLTEALLCGIPVVAPDSTAMGEYISEDTGFLVPTVDRDIAAIAEPFGAGFAKQYGEPGNVCFEPRVDLGRRQLRQVFENHAEGKERAARGGETIRRDFNWDGAAREVEEACLDLLSG